MLNKEFLGAIALTGSISTGKSSVAKILQKHGNPVIDADKVAHKMLDLHSSDISKIFGKNTVENGLVKRDCLREIVFKDKSQLKVLEEFIHPIIHTEISHEASKYESLGQTYFIDIPLFFENKSYNIEKSLVVFTPKEIQLQRLMKRDGISVEDANNRIALQLPIDHKVDLANYVIDNSGTLENLTLECKRVLEEIKIDSN